MIATVPLILDPLKLLWLDKISSITDEAATLTDEEKKRADTIKATPRRDEFIRSRLLLRSITGANSSFLPDTENTPSWPPGLCGSITHKNGHVAVCTAPAKNFHSIGIDSENASKDISHLKEKICTENDLVFIDRICEQSKVEQGSAIALIFSAKEALFKCHFPVGKLMFWFHDAELSHIDMTTGEIDIRVLTETSPITQKGQVTRGRFLLHNASDGAFWVTAFTLPKDKYRLS